MLSKLDAQPIEDALNFENLRRLDARIPSRVMLMISIYITVNDTLNGSAFIVLSGRHIYGWKITSVDKICSGRIECVGGGAIRYRHQQSERKFHHH